MRSAPLLASLIGCSTASGPEPASDPWPATLDRFADYAGDGGAGVGTHLAPFKLLDQYGAVVDFRQFLGHVLLVETEATWSGSSQEAATTRADLLVELQADGPVWILTVLTQDTGGRPPDVGTCATWAQRFGLDFPVLADLRQEQQQQWSIQDWPTSLVVAPDGTVLQRHEEPVGDEQLATEVRAALIDHAEELRADS